MAKGAGGGSDSAKELNREAKYWEMMLNEPGVIERLRDESIPHVVLLEEVVAAQLTGTDYNRDAIENALAALNRSKYSHEMCAAFRSALSLPTIEGRVNRLREIIRGFKIWYMIPPDCWDSEET